MKETDKALVAIPSGHKDTEDYLKYITHNINENALGEIPQIFQKKFETIRKNLTYKKDTISSNGVFTITKDDSGNKMIILPKNLEEALDHPVIGVILTYIVSLPDLKFRLSENEDISLVPAQDKTRLFFLGLINRLQSGLPESGFNFSAREKYPSERGRACADCEFFCHSSKIDSKFFCYLPQSVRTTSNGKVLKSELFALLGQKQRMYVDRLMSIFTYGSKLKIDTVTEKVINQMKIPLGFILKSLVRYHKVKKLIDKKLVEKSVPIHYNRPSKIIEIVLEEERILLSTLEEPWDNIKQLTEEHQKGVPLAKVDEFIISYKKFYGLQGEVVKRISQWRSVRRQAMADYLPKGRNSRPFKEIDKQPLIDWVCRSHSRNEPSFHEIGIDSFNYLKLKKRLVDDFNSGIIPFLEVGRLISEKSVQHSLRYIKDIDDKKLFIKALSWIPPDSDLAQYIGLTSYLENEANKDSAEIPQSIEDNG